MIWPEPNRISDFKPLPNSAKSTLEGDTIQIPNVSAYFSNQFRQFVVPFYLKDYQQNSHFPFPPLKLNHPPEDSWVVIKKPTDTTYLEELVYPAPAETVPIFHVTTRLSGLYDIFSLAGDIFPIQSTYVGSFCFFYLF